MRKFIEANDIKIEQKSVCIDPNLPKLPQLNQFHLNLSRELTYDVYDRPLYWFCSWCACELFEPWADQMKGSNPADQMKESSRADQMKESNDACRRCFTDREFPHYLSDHMELR